MGILLILLYQPFDNMGATLKEFQTCYSTSNTTVVKEIDRLSGAFTATVQNMVVQCKLKILSLRVTV